MNVSLSWIFDHIAASWRDYPLNDIVRVFTQKTAEIEQITPVSCHPDAFTLVEVVSCEGENVLCKSFEWNKTYYLPTREGVAETHTYLVIREELGVRWATMADLGSDKESLLPAFSVSRDDMMGEWKRSFEWDDCILHISSSAITHRPDLWSCRGIAREIAAHFNIPLIEEAQFLAPIETKHHRTELPSDDQAALSMRIESEACNRLSTLAFPHFHPKYSSLWMATRLARCSIRSHQLIIDITNYVMMDIGQPMHAFDAHTLSGSEICARQARAGEVLVTLDQRTLQLSEDDLVIADAERPLSLAGIMGGFNSGVTTQTTALVLEAGAFNAPVIRQSSTRHKIRTESSARFEKSLDLDGPEKALKRALALLAHEHAVYTHEPYIRSLGHASESVTVTCAHDYLVKKLGIDRSVTDVKHSLEALGFAVQVVPGQEVIYHITVPSWRATGDVSIPEDIVEEVGRCIGYDTIAPQLPLRAMTSIDHSSWMKMLKRARLATQLLGLDELVTYGIVDEEFIHEAGITHQGSLRIAHPLSQTWQYLAPTLLFGLLKAASKAAHTVSTGGFFEQGRYWGTNHTNAIDEHSAIAGVWHRRTTDSARVDMFYECKALLQRFEHELEWNITWDVGTSETIPSWCDSASTARLLIDGICVGYAGFLSQESTRALFEDSHVFVWEYTIDRIESIHASVVPYRHRKHFDISILVDQSRTAQQWASYVQEQSPSVIRVMCIDTFTKSSWEGKRSLTLRCFVQESADMHESAALTAVHAQIVSALEHQGCIIR